MILEPPNLHRLGLPKASADTEPDLITVWKTPYPVIMPYFKLCRKLDIRPFAGGTMEQQGPKYTSGYINSAYRPYVVNGNQDSPHMYAFALDIFILPPLDVIVAAEVSAPLYQRIGIYPYRGFIHVDQAPDIWINRHHKAIAWVQLGAETTYFQDKEEALRFARQAA